MEAGRPPYYKEGDQEIVKGLCESYFVTIHTEFEEKEVWDEDKQEYVIKNIMTKYAQPPTVTGLTLHLGFSSKNTLYDYAKNPLFSDSIKRALTRIEQHHEIAAANGDKCVGNIFILKNFGWKDTHSIDMKDVTNLPPEISFVDTDE